ncbi:hypothetical protein [Streptomyces sp. NPDC059909]|uniref:hypothetical protein n=1 Tax=Streptomyces sp. NPDC059909 TaxID=3346998 RepID=UPI00364DC3F8
MSRDVALPRRAVAEPGGLLGTARSAALRSARAGMPLNSSAEPRGQGQKSA